MGESPLDRACSRGHREAVNALLKAGASLGGYPANGRTPLHVAARYGRSEVVKILLEAGANPHAQLTAGDWTGQKPIHQAVEGGNLETIKLLLGKESDTGTIKELLLYVFENSGPLTRFLLDAGADIEISDWSRGSPLSRFITRNDCEGVKQLLSAGARADAGTMKMAEVSVQRARTERVGLLQSDLSNAILLPSERAVIAGERVAAAELCLSLIKAKVEGEIVAAVRAATAEIGSPTMKDMGRVMKSTMSRLAGGPADGKMVSDIVKRELAQSECPRSAPKAKPEVSSVPVLTCRDCGRTYRIGDNAVAVTLEYGLRLARGAVIVSDGSTADREDLVAVLDVSPEALPGARQEARENWKIIRNSLSQGHRRAWRCKACDKVNAYP